MPKQRASPRIEQWLEDYQAEMSAVSLEENEKIVETESHNGGVLAFEEKIEDHCDLDLEEILTKCGKMTIGELAFNYKLFKKISEANAELIYATEQATDKQDRLSEDAMIEIEAAQDELSEWIQKVKTARRMNTNFENEATRLKDKHRLNTVESEIIEEFHDNSKEDFKELVTAIDALRERRALFAIATTSSVEKLHENTKALIDENTKRSELLADLRKELNDIKIAMIDNGTESEDESNPDLDSDTTENSNIKDEDNVSELAKPVTEKPIKYIMRDFAFQIHSATVSHTEMERSISPDTDKTLRAFEQNVNDDDEIKLSLTEFSSPKTDDSIENERPATIPNVNQLDLDVLSPGDSNTPVFEENDPTAVKEHDQSVHLNGTNQSDINRYIADNTTNLSHSMPSSRDANGFQPGLCYDVNENKQKFESDIGQTKSCIDTRSQLVSRIPTRGVRAPSRCDGQSELIKNKPRKFVPRSDYSIDTYSIESSVSHVHVDETAPRFKSRQDTCGLEKKIELAPKIEDKIINECDKNSKIMKLNIKARTHISYEGHYQSAKTSPRKLPPIDSTFQKQLPGKTKLPSIAQRPGNISPIHANNGKLPAIVDSQRKSTPNKGTQPFVCEKLPSLAASQHISDFSKSNLHSENTSVNKDVVLKHSTTGSSKQSSLPPKKPSINKVEIKTTNIQTETNNTVYKTKNLTPIRPKKTNTKSKTKIVLPPVTRSVTAPRKCAQMKSVGFNGVLPAINTNNVTGKHDTQDNDEPLRVPNPKGQNNNPTDSNVSVVRKLKDLSKRMKQY